ncbi:MAG: BlaI/MecI/CopY family transcriptional regulator [Candidatus Tumulicola sp.]
MSRKLSFWNPHPLGPLQAAVMEALWVHGPLSAVELQERLTEQQDWAYTTIHTELSRLLKKGLVAKRGQNRETRYATPMTRDEYLRATVRHTLSDLIGAHGAAAIHGFVELVEDNEAAIEELRRAVRKRPKR